MTQNVCVQFKIKLRVRNYIYHLRNISFKIFRSLLSFSLSFSFFSFMQLRNHAGYYSLCIVGHDKIHRLLHPRNNASYPISRKRFFQIDRGKYI